MLNKHIISLYPPRRKMYPTYYHMMSYICEIGDLNVNDKIYETILSSHWTCKWVQYLDSYQILYNVANCYCNVGGVIAILLNLCYSPGQKQLYVNKLRTYYHNKRSPFDMLYENLIMKKSTFSIYRLHCGAINMLKLVKHQGYFTDHTMHRERHVPSTIKHMILGLGYLKNIVYRIWRSVTQN